MTRKELRTLARDIVEGRAFGSWQAPEDMLSMIFMPVVFMEKAELQKLLDDGIVEFYEYMDKALPRGVNGYPMFMSCHMLNMPDMLMLRVELRRYQNIRQIQEDGIIAFARQWLSNTVKRWRKSIAA